MKVEAYLLEVPLFNQLHPESLSALVRKGEVMAFESGQIVCAEGETSDAMYVILAGEVRVFKEDEEGNEVDINRQRQGECFGELALLDSRPRSASVVCATQCRLFKLEKIAFMDLLSNPDTQSMAFSILSVLVARVREVTEKYFDEQLAQRVLQAEMEADRHRSLAQMVAGVAHELNTPLGITNTAVGMIATRVQNEHIVTVLQDDLAASVVLGQMLEASELALRNIERAHKLVQNFKKISVNQLTADLETGSLPDLVRDILDLFKINARQAQLQITVQDLLPHDQKTWTGYPGHLTQVLTNLLTNIERYAYPDRRGGKIDISLGAIDETFALTVEDYGEGIAADHLPQIFTPFFTTGRTIGGSGLGLAIVHNIVTEALHGAIDVESTTGEGTRFVVTFPQVLD